MIISLEKIRDPDLRLVGSKAFGLARMKQIGLIVPTGFCITATAFREHLETNNLICFIVSIAGKLNSASLEERKTILLEIQQSIINAPLAGKLRDEIENHYRTLAANRIAVRSSATAEDLPGHSFAGRYETYLGISDLAGCIEAVKKCWASVWIERAYEYRQKNDFDHLAVDMAVIVQSLVEADASGVIFTANPINGYKSRIVVETVSGLGDSLVSGKATPQRFVVAKKKCRIISKNLTSESCITDSVVKRLAKLGKKVEKHFGSPQDIEWAISGNKIYFLQARPITAIPQKKSWEERQVWTNANTGEVIPDVATPMSWSMVSLFVEKLCDSFFGWCGFELEDNPMFGLISGRPYFNINTAVGAAKYFPEKWMLKFNDVFGGKHGEMFNAGLLDIPEEDVPKIKFHPIKFILNIPIFLLNFLLHSQKKSESYIAGICAANDHLENLDLNKMSEESLATNASSAIEQRSKFTDSIGIIKGIDCFLILNLICGKWLKNSTLTNRFLVGVGSMEDAQAGLDMWQLAADSHSFAEVEKIITSDNNWQNIKDKLVEVEGGELFLKKWDQFMVRHGHHCRGEIEMYNPRWWEQPDYILNLLRSYLSNLEKYNPVENQRRQRLKRQELSQQCYRKLTNPLKRLLFKYFLKHAQQGGIFRENWKNQIVRCVALVRKILLHLGEKLQKRGVFDNSYDIFFLKYQEIKSVVQGKANFDVKEVIAQRRVEYEKNKSVMPPKVVIGKFNPDDYTPDAVDTNAEVLNGLAVSSGVVTGKARVILKADTDEQVLPGEILVAPFTDPGWTPYFIPAAAIVMDIGGLLSHGSIIVREYGIPAVVNVGSATKIIKTGQTIQVDANRGIVKIIR